MNTALWIARRLKPSDHTSRRSSVSVKVSVTSVAIAVAVMLLTLAVVTGFRNHIIDKVTGFESQITVSAYDDNLQQLSPALASPAILDAIAQSLPEGATVDLSMTQPALLKTPDNFAAVAFRGFSKGKDYGFLSENIIGGMLPAWEVPDAASSIVISSVTAAQTGLRPGDSVETCFFTNGRIRPRKFKVAAIYQSYFPEYDKTVAFADYATLKRIGALDADETTRIEINGVSSEASPQIAAAIQSTLNNAYINGSSDRYMVVEEIHQSAALYFNWLSLLDTNVVVIIILMGAIAVFTLISSLFIIILERVSMIGTLKTIGATDAEIRRIFIFLASKILLRGIVIGTAIALALYFMQATWQLIPLDPDSYFISYVPVSLTWLQVMAVDVAAILAGILVMILPSSIISRLRPASTVRYE